MDISAFQGEKMNVTKTIKRLSKLKTYKKYKAMNPKVISLAQEILVRDLIGEIDNDDIILNINKETITIDKMIAFVPVVFMKISMFSSTDANVKLGHFVALNESSVKNYKLAPYSPEKSWHRVVTACNYFNSLCDKANKGKVEFIKDLKEGLKDISFTGKNEKE